MKTPNQNQSATWFKILTHEGKPIDGSSEKWSLPYRQYKGDTLNFEKQPAYCFNGDDWMVLPQVRGTWLVRNPKTIYSCNGQQRIYVAKLLAPINLEISGMVWVAQVQLLREATNMDVKPFGIYRAFKQLF